MMSDIEELVTPVILAGGRVAQLLEVWDGPAVLVPVGEVPFVTHTLDRLVDAGFKHAVVASGVWGSGIEESIGTLYHRGFTYQQPPDLEIDYVYESSEVPLGTGGVIRRVVDQVETRNILLVMDGNTYNGTVLQNFWQWLRCAAANFGPLELGLQATRMMDISGWDVVNIDPETGLVEAFCPRDRRGLEDGKFGWVSTGMYLVPRSCILEKIPAGVPSSFEDDYIPSAIARAGALGYRRLCKVLEIRTMEGLEKARRFFDVKGRKDEPVVDEV